MSNPSLNTIGRRRVPRNLTLFPLLLSGALLGGCANQPTLSQISAFGDAANSVSVKATKGIDLVDNAVIDEQLYLIAQNPDLFPNDADFKGLFGDEAVVRVQALGQLGQYATGLKILATADVSADVDAAAKDLNESLTALSASNQKLNGSANPTDLGVIATAVDSIGTAIVEAKKREAIRTVIEQADQTVQDVAKAISEDFIIVDSKAFGDLSTVAATNTERAETKKLDCSIDAVATGNFKSATGSVGDRARSGAETVRRSLISQYKRDRAGLKFQERIKRLQEINKATTQVKQLEKFFPTVGCAAQQLANTHAVLLKEVEKDNFDSGEIAREVGELAQYASLLSTISAALGD